MSAWPISGRPCLAGALAIQVKSNGAIAEVVVVFGVEALLERKVKAANC